MNEDDIKIRIGVKFIDLTPLAASPYPHDLTAEVRRDIRARRYRAARSFLAGAVTVLILIATCLGIYFTLTRFTR